jgi:hypothetical protein
VSRRQEDLRHTLVLEIDFNQSPGQPFGVYLDRLILPKFGLDSQNRVSTKHKITGDLKTG